MMLSAYMFVASIWFYQEWTEHKKLLDALIKGLFWPYEAIEIFNKWRK